MATRPGMQRVVITGMGVASPLGCSLDEFWARLLAGDSGVRLLPEIDLTPCPTKIGAAVSGLDENAYFSHKERKRLSRSTLLGLVAADQAVEAAGGNLAKGDGHRRGVIMGSSIAGYTAAEPFFEEYFTGWRGSPYIIPKVMNNAPASNISIRHGFIGPLLTTDAACASAAHAVGYAFQQVRHGILDMALTGAADVALSPAVMQAWSLLRVLSERNETPKQACRPFSGDRDGLVLGEGAGVLLLESESSARGRAAQIYGEVLGYGATSDGHHITQPSVSGPREAMRLAIEDAGLQVEQIDYVNAHATGTQANDGNESTAIKQVLGEHAYKIPVVGIKGAIGHSIAASGALELISTVLSIRDGKVPPTINLTTPDPECDLDYVGEGQRAVDVRYALSNSFAFGGSNAALVVGRYEERG